MNIIQIIIIFYIRFLCPNIYILILSPIMRYYYSQSKDYYNYWNTLSPPENNSLGSHRIVFFFLILSSCLMLHANFT